MRSRVFITRTVAAGLLALAAPAAAQEPIDRAMIERIKAEGQQRSRTPELFQTLIDVMGARLTGSPAYNDAAAWARDRFAEWGLSQPRLEPFEFGRGWSLEKLTIEMTSPRYMPLIGYAEAWTPSAAGVITGTPVYIGT